MIQDGWGQADKDSASVQNAAKFAMQEKFPGSDVSYIIVDALQQVVAGMNYELTLDVTENTSLLCGSHKYVVYNRFDGSLTLTKSTDLGACA